MQLQLHTCTPSQLCKYLKMSQVPFDPFIAFGVHLVALVYSVTLATKMFHTSLKMRANQLIDATIVFSMVLAVLTMAADSWELSDVNGDEQGVLFAVGGGFEILMTFSLVALLDIRNHILIPDKRAFIISRAVLGFTVTSSLITMVPFWIFIGPTQHSINYFTSTLLLNMSNVGAAMWGVGISVYDVISVVYLWKYYQRYFFGNKQVMNILGRQMAYRRSWILFVMFMDVATVVLTIIGATGIYTESTQDFLTLSLLFQLNTMIDFVRFDTVRHEITIRGYTISLGDGTDKEDIDSLIPKVC